MNKYTINTKDMAICVIAEDDIMIDLVRKYITRKFNITFRTIGYIFSYSSPQAIIEFLMGIKISFNN